MSLRHLEANPSTKRRVSFRASLVGGSLKTAKHRDREHLVVPVIALVEGVVHASNSEHPELVLGEELEKFPGGWNGRPVVWDHPVLNGIRVSANEPMVLERMQIGEVFGAFVENGKLKVDAYLDIERCEALGGTAAKVLARVRAGETIEVSVGAFVEEEKKSGVRDGKRFSSVWRNIVPDHLAFLPEGTEGACSVEMGCGAPRAASAKEDDKMTWKERLKALLERATSAAPSGDSEVRMALERVLFAEHAGFAGVVEVFSEAGKVVFAVAPEGEIKLFRQSYAYENSTASLKGTPEEVKEQRQFVAATASCGCGGHEPVNAPAQTQEENMNKKQLAAKIIAACKLPETASADLEKLPEETLKAMAAKAEEEPVEPKKEPETPPVEKKEEEAKELTEEQMLDKMPGVKEILTQHKAAEAKKKADSIALIAASAHKDLFSKEQLEGKSVEELEKIAKMATASAPVDNTGRGGPRAASSGQEDDRPKVPDMKAKILALRAK